MKKFEWIEHPSDVGFRAYGKTISEAFENAALALFEIMVDTAKVEPKIKKNVSISAEDLGALLYDWLDRLIALYDSEGIVCSQFRVEISKTAEGYQLEAEVWGERFDPGRHPERTAVKAMTYHLMEIHEEPGNCWIQAVVDI